MMILYTIPGFRMGNHHSVDCLQDLKGERAKSSVCTPLRIDGGGGGGGGARHFLKIAHRGGVYPAIQHRERSFFGEGAAHTLLSSLVT